MPPLLVGHIFFKIDQNIIFCGKVSNISVDTFPWKDFVPIINFEKIMADQKRIISEQQGVGKYCEKKKTFFL